MISDQQLIVEIFPRNTRETKLNGFTGWLYTLPNQSSDAFEMFVYNDHNRYQVIVVSPKDDSKYSLENINISGDGRIVYNSKNGFSSLKEAFEISKRWVELSSKKGIDMPDSRQKVDKINPPEYDEKDFWRKLNENALKAGKNVIEKALILYYATQSEDVPAWAKAIIFPTLAYFILPSDLVPDIFPDVGYTDDLGVLVTAFLSVGMNLTPEHEEAAKKKLQQWFGRNEA